MDSMELYCSVQSPNGEKAVLEENSNTFLAGLGGMAFFLDKLVMVPPAIAPVVNHKRHKDLTKVTFLS